MHAQNPTNSELAGLGKVSLPDTQTMPEAVLFVQQIQDAAQAFLAVQGEEAQPVPQPPAPRKFKLLTGADVLALPMPRYIVKGLIPDKGIIVFYGQSATGKTYVLLSLVLAIAEGGPWFGLPTQCREVVYVYLESCGGLQKRLTAWELDRKSTTPLNVHFVIEPFHILEDIETLAPDIPQGAVVVIDTMNAAASGLDENSSRDMGLIIDSCKKLQRLTDGLVVLVHHTGKDATKGMRGHSSLFGALDAAFEVGRNGDARYWKVTKAKENEDGMRQGFRLKPVGIGFDQDGVPQTSCVVESVEAGQDEEKPLTPALAYCLESLERALAAHGKEAVHLEEWRPLFYERHTGDSDGAKRAAFNRDKGKLVHLGKVIVQDNNYSLSVPAYRTVQKRTDIRSPEPQTAYRTVHPSLEGVRSTQGDGYAYE